MMQKLPWHQLGVGNLEKAKTVRVWSFLGWNLAQHNWNRESYGKCSQSRERGRNLNSAWALSASFHLGCSSNTPVQVWVVISSHVAGEWVRGGLQQSAQWWTHSYLPSHLCPLGFLVNYSPLPTPVKGIPRCCRAILKWVLFSRYCRRITKVSDFPPQQSDKPIERHIEWQLQWALAVAHGCQVTYWLA